MIAFLSYDLKVAALIAVFYMFYRLLLSRETFHRVNRLVLLLTAVASFVLPLCVITWHRQVVVAQRVGQVSIDGLQPMVVAEVATPAVPLWQKAAVALFFLGMACTLAFTIYNVARVVLLIRRSERHPQTDGITLVVTDRQVSPFSWCRYIVLNRADYEQPHEAVLTHERAHIRLRHSRDVMLVDTLTALQWFNPAMWMLRQDLRAIHEYEADRAVLSQGINMREYQYLLIHKAVGSCGYSVANSITHSTLKNRINMMLNNKNQNRTGLLKLLALVPIVGLALALNARTVTDYVYDTDTPQTPQKKLVKKGRKDGQLKINGTTINVKADTATVKLVNGNAELDQKQLKRQLLVVDGKRVDNPDEFIQNLDPATISHIEVLKSEDAKKVFNKIYGGDATEGVIVITTMAHAAAHEAQGIFVPSDDAPTTDEKTFDVVEQMPQFAGGPQKLFEFLARSIKYPAAAEKAGEQGRVIVSFVVDKEGNIVEPRVVRSVSELLDQEALRVINLMPKWEPGRQNGQVVRVKYTLPMTFKLDDAPAKQDAAADSVAFNISNISVISYSR